MQSTEFYRSLLQLSSDWSVSKIETTHEEQSIHVYLSVVSNAETGQVLAVRDGRTTEAAMRAIAEAVPPHQRSDVKAVAMDMAPVFRYPVRTLLPAAQIVHDKFHLFQYLTQAIDVT